MAVVFTLSYCIKNPYVTSSFARMGQCTACSKTDVHICLAYWIAFGPHGPRALPPPGENWYVFRMTMFAIGISCVIFWGLRQMARPAPGTMNAQYQEMTNEYLRVSDSEFQAWMPHVAFCTCRADSYFLPLESKNRTHYWCFL